MDVSAKTLIIAYHYVRPVDLEQWGGLFPLSPAEFEAQLQDLANRGDFLAPSDIDEPISDTRPRFVLTFDDGTFDHYQYAYPILKKRNIPALFAVMSAPITEGYIPTFHYVHVLTSKLGDEAIWGELCRTFSSEHLANPEEARKKYARESSELRCLVKYSLNYSLGDDEARSVLQKLFAEHLGSEDAFIKQWYLQEEQIREMHQAGMTIVPHCHRHLPYFEPAEAYYEAEVAPCEHWLHEVLGERPRDFVIPYGGFNAETNPIYGCEDVLRAHGYQHVHTTGRDWNEPMEFFTKRWDAADLPPRVPWPEQLEV